MRRRMGMGIVAIAAAALMLGSAAPADACAALVAPNGTIRLLRTTTLAAYHDGLEHYVTSFQFAGDGAELGSIVPLPAVPTKVERGGDWTLQRLQRETALRNRSTTDGANVAAASGGSGAQVLYETTIDALDITILKGGGREVGQWATDHGYALSPDAPEILEFYSWRSPIFMAARFDAEAARQRGQTFGDGTPIHLTIPTRNPWVPLRILGLGREKAERIDADVYLLTDRRPALLPVTDGLQLQFDEQASDSLLDDLRSDKGMEWVPTSAWLTKLGVSETAGKLRYDLAVDASGRGRPWHLDAGLRKPRPVPTTVTALPSTTVVPTLTTEATIRDLAFASRDEKPGIDPDGAPWFALLTSFGVAAAIALGATWRRRRAEG